MPTVSSTSRVASWMRSSSLGLSTSHQRRGAMGLIREVIAATSQGSDDGRSGVESAAGGQSRCRSEGARPRRRTGLETAGAVDRADADGGCVGHGPSLSPASRAANRRQCACAVRHVQRLLRPRVTLPGRCASTSARMRVEARLHVVRQLEGARLGAQLRDPRLQTVEQRLRPVRLPRVVTRRVEAGRSARSAGSACACRAGPGGCRPAPRP